MEEAADPQSVSNAAITRKGVQSTLLVEFNVLARIQDIKSCDPKRYCRGEQQDARIQRASHCNPCGGGSDSESEPQHQVRPARPAFCIRVKKHDCKSYW